MLPLDDPRWPALQGGYRTAYDATPALRALAEGGEPGVIWERLWQELHHQGDVGTASYAAVPHLVSSCRNRRLYDWNLFALASIIEICRGRPRNPPLPEWLADSYRQAWRELFEFGIEALRACVDPLVVQSVLGVIALHKGLTQLGAVLAMADESEIREVYELHCS